MNNLLYYLAVILIIIWAILFLAYAAGPIIHILLLIAWMAVVLRIINDKKQ